MAAKKKVEQSFRLPMTPEEFRMLDELAKAEDRKKVAIVRRLIREAYEKTIGKKWKGR